MGAEATAATVPNSDTVTHHQRGALDRELYCAQLARLLMSAAGELGQRGNLHQVVSCIERGGVGGGGEDPNLGMLRRLGATDNRPIDNRLRQLRELDQRWRALSTKHQALALAHYLGTPRADASVREHFGNGSDPEAQQGSLAGVALYRWQLKQEKARSRSLTAGAALVEADLESVRAALLPLEQELTVCRARLDAPLVLPDLGPEPVRPAVPMVLRRRLLEKALSGYNRRWRARYAALRQAREADANARWDAQLLVETLAPQVRTLRDEQARLAAQQAALAAVGAASDDELALVKLCRGGLTKDALVEMRRAAEGDVRALHRAWYATGKRQAKAWAEEVTPA